MGNENDSLIGRQLGSYQIQASLGEGGMARVYKAYHPRLRREVAIKVILAEIAHREGFQERFEREAQMIASLEHPNIVSVYDFGEEGNLTYLVMQYVGGGTLRDQLRGKRPLEFSRAAHYAHQMALALHHAHQRGIVHRDVKPQNMLVSGTDSRHLLLSDFGIAKLYYQDDGDAVLPEMPTREMTSSTLTGASQIIGTADYMSPEQASAQPVDARTDVYALGVVLYQMLTGDVPFHSTTLPGLLFQHVYTPSPPVRVHNPQVPEILEQITAKALAKAPAERFQSAEDMARALAQANSYATLPGPCGAFQSQVGEASPWMHPTTGPFNQPVATRYTTLSLSPSGTDNERATSAPALLQSATRQVQIPGKPAYLRLLGYTLAVLALVVGLVVFGLRWLPILGGNTSTTLPPGNSSTTGAPVKAFHEQFQDNHLNWLAGNLAPGVTASTPGGGVYTITLSTNTTAFPYPQAVDTLPASFTLAATLRQTAGATDDVYGLAFHFTQDSNNQISCYAFVVDGGGAYAIYEYTGSHLSTISTGTYQPGKQQVLRVKAQGNTYSFSINGQTIQIASGSQSPGTTWSNGDLHDGRVALLFAGPRSGEATATFQTTDVQLSLP